MVFNKILFLCFAVLVINIRESQSHFITSHHRNLLNDCACFPKTRNTHPVSEVAIKHGRFERKVVYLFKHLDTGSISVYVPKKAKQLKFPDLTIDIEDIYGFPKLHSLHELFEEELTLSPTIVLHKHDNKPIETIVVDSSINHQQDSNPEIVDVNVHVETNSNLTNTNKQTEVLVPIHQHVTKRITKSEHNTKKERPVTVPHHLTVRTTKSEHITKKVTPVTVPHPVTQRTTKHTDGNQETIHLIDVENINYYPTNHNQVIENIVEYNKPPDHLIEIEKLNPQRKQVYIKYTSPRPVDLEQKHPTSPTKLNQNEFNLIENIGLVDGSDTGLLNIIRNFVNGKHQEPPFSPDIIKQSHPNFDIWLIKQIQLLGNKVIGSTETDSVELQKLKYHLLNLIAKSGFHFDVNGDLIDLEGHSLKITNLKLQRVMISDPEVYKKILAQNKCSANLPYEIPYLEAVFVSLVYPPRILGVIPLKMTLLPKCNGDICHKKTGCNSNSGGVLAVPLNTKHTLNLSMSPKAGEEGDSREEPNLTKEETEASEELNPSETDDIDDDEGVSIKIVGGSAATSSGTPVNSRGRSGYDNGHWFFLK